MTYEEIWQKIKQMSQRDRKMLAYEVSLSLKPSTEGKEAVGYIHPHYYFDAKAVHDILFYQPKSQHEIEDNNGKYYNALKKIIENNKIIHVRIRRYKWLPRFINDYCENRVVKSYICSRFNGEWLNRYYSISSLHKLNGKRSRTLFLWLNDESEVLYKMISCNDKNGYEEMTFERMEG